VRDQLLYLIKKDFLKYDGTTLFFLPEATPPPRGSNHAPIDTLPTLPLGAEPRSVDHAACTRSMEDGSARSRVACTVGIAPQRIVQNIERSKIE
jgi:hypothetical protein